MMQKDETHLLSHWIEYHGNLFGLENLYVYDNGSSNLGCLEVIDKYKKLGVHFYFEFDSQADFLNKGKILGNKILELEATNEYDFFIPLDCDEFIGTISDVGVISCDRKIIHDELDMHGKTEDILLFRYQLYNSVFSSMWFSRRYWPKIFFRSGTFGWLDQGYHHGKSKNGSGEHKTNLIQFHLHNKPFSTVQAHTLRKLSARLGDKSREEILNYVGAGQHVIKYLRMDEHQYWNHFLRTSHQQIPALMNAFSSLGLDWPFNDSAIASQNALFELLLLGHDAPKLEFSENFPHGLLNGFVDLIIDRGSTIGVTGWSFGVDAGIKNFQLRMNGNAIAASKNYQEISRPDVARLFPQAQIGCGFNVDFELSADYLKELNGIEILALDISNSSVMILPMAKKLTS
jgi:hypothetical protein